MPVYPLYNRGSSTIVTEAFFHLPYTLLMKGYARIAAAVPAAAVADITANRERTLTLWREADMDGTNVVVFPELGLSGYSIRDLCMNTTLLDACESSLAQLIEAGKSLEPVAIVGLPVRFNHGLYKPDSKSWSPWKLYSNIPMISTRFWSSSIYFLSA